MINLRKPSQAFIPDGSITKEKIADNAIDANKIEDGAVDLSTAKVTGELPEAKLADNAVTTIKIANDAVDSTKLADNAVIEAKLADLAISTEKLKDSVVTLAKTNDDVKITPFVGGEEEQSVTGDVETGIIETGFVKVTNKYDPVKLRIIASLKVDAGEGNEATMGIFIDNEVAARITKTSTSNTYELVNGEADISDLPKGKHNIVVKIKSNVVGVKAWNDYIDVFFVK